jgi:hypothetical protein
MVINGGKNMPATNRAIFGAKPFIRVIDVKPVANEASAGMQWCDL